MARTKAPRDAARMTNSSSEDSLRMRVKKARHFEVRFCSCLSVWPSEKEPLRSFQPESALFAFGRITGCIRSSR